MDDDVATRQAGAQVASQMLACDKPSVARLPVDILPARRVRLLVEQLREEWVERHGDAPGFQRDTAKRTGMSESQVSRLLNEKRGGGDLKTLFDVIETMRLRPDFFFDETIEAPRYRDYLRSRDAGPAPVPESQAWRTFLEIEGPRVYGLTPEQTEWLRTAPFRGGAQSVDDYIAAARALTCQTAERPPGWDAAVQKERGRR